MPDTSGRPADAAADPRPAESTEVGQRWHVVPGPDLTDSPGRRRTGFRTALAIGVGRAAAWASRRFGFGSGGMIGGRLALTIQPDLLPQLVLGRRVVMVTGTNGKTTTTQMVAEALRSRAPAISNATGANMPDGHVAALIGDRAAPFAALEVDELHLGQVTDEFEPAVILLLNLSRDQMDRVGEIRTVVSSLSRAVQRAPGARVIANADDPNIVQAVADHPRTTWVAAGARWQEDALNCPRCGAAIARQRWGPWTCSCGLSRPAPDWTVTDTGVLDAAGAHHELALALPGHVNRVNATFALATALLLRCDGDAALEHVSRIDQAAGRYGTVRLADREVRLLLAKNPASWLEMLELVAEHEQPLLLVLNSREADGYDVSWLWDVDFEVLRGRAVFVAGDRALDLAVRLRYAGIQHRVKSDVDEALIGMPEGVPDVIANYTAFRDLFARRRG